MYILRFLYKQYVVRRGLNASLYTGRGFQKEISLITGFFPVYISLFSFFVFCQKSCFHTEKGEWWHPYSTVNRKMMINRKNLFNSATKNRKKFLQLCFYLYYFHYIVKEFYFCDGSFGNIKQS